MSIIDYFANQEKKEKGIKDDINNYNTFNRYRAFFYFLLCAVIIFVYWGLKK